MLIITNIAKLSHYVIKATGTPSFSVSAISEFDTYYEITLQQNASALLYKVELGRELEYGGTYSITCHALSIMDAIPAAEMINPELVMKRIAKFLPIPPSKIVKVC